MLILGIETSCDEASAAVVQDGRVILSNVIASQIPVHERFGGVVPEIASRQHVLAIDSIVRRALDEARLQTEELDAVAATFGPGLSGPLLVGTSFAKGMAMAAGLPLIAVNHMEGHVLSVWLHPRDVDPVPPPPELPMVTLIASGGHTELVEVTRPAIYRLMGRTVDDAAGEAFDKVGRILGLPYPGGPNIERVAVAAPDPEIVFPRAWLPGTFDFSFSGLKTAVSRTVSASLDATGSPEPNRVAAIAAAFQTSVADVLATKLRGAVESVGAASAALVGGVASNSYIRDTVRQRLDVPLHLPGPGLSTDNAAMIAAAAYWSQNRVGYDADVMPNLTWSNAALRV